MVDSAPRKKGKKVVPLEKKHARVLRAVAAINGVMFLVESAMGYFAHSSALVADSADMLGDALGAAGGVIVRKSSRKKQAKVALAKGLGMAVVGLSVLGGTAFLLATPVMPVLATMAIVGGVAFLANAACAAMLYRYRKDNINLKSTWKCTRNDMVSNLGVLAAAGLGRLLVSPIPDIVVGMLVSGLFIKSSIGVVRESIGIIRDENKKEKAETMAAAAAPPKVEPKNNLGLRQGLNGTFNRQSPNRQSPNRQSPDRKKTPEAAPTPAPTNANEQTVAVKKEADAARRAL